jgi:hypothetical protein
MAASTPNPTTASFLRIECPPSILISSLADSPVRQLALKTLASLAES